MATRFYKIFKPVSIVILIAAIVFCVVTRSLFVIKFYPVLINVALLFAFGITLFFPPTMIFRFACLQDKTIKGSLSEKSVENYCRKVTIVWCVFFILNGSFAGFTIIYGSDILWVVYNAGVANILMGMLFLIEFIVRKRMQRRNKEAEKELIGGLNE